MGPARPGNPRSATLERPGRPAWELASESGGARVLHSGSVGWAGPGQREANCSGLGDTRFAWQRPAQHERSTRSDPFVLAQAPPPAKGALCASAWAGPSLESESRSQGGALQLLNPTSRWREDCLPLHNHRRNSLKKPVREQRPLVLLVPDGRYLLSVPPLLILLELNEPIHWVEHSA